MSGAAFQFAIYNGGFGYVYPVLDTAELQAKIEADNSLSDMCWQLPARGWPGAATDVTHPLFTKDLPKIELNKLVYPEGGVMNWGYVYVALRGVDVEQVKKYPTCTLTLQTNDATNDTLQFANFTLVASIPLWEVGSNANAATGGRITAITDSTDDSTLHLCLFADERFWAANFPAHSAAAAIFRATGTI